MKSVVRKGIIWLSAVLGVLITVVALLIGTSALFATAFAQSQRLLACCQWRTVTQEQVGSTAVATFLDANVD